MERLLELLQFRTAVLFGYCVFWSLSLLGLPLGITLLVQGLRRNPRARRRIAGGMMILGFVMLQLIMGVASIVFDSSLNLNPTPAASDLQGSWLDRDTTLDIRADGTFNLKTEEPLATRIGSTQTTGTWKLDDWNLHLTTASGRSLTRLRVIQFAERYRIIVDDVDDFDCWDGRLGFRRQ